VSGFNQLPLAAVGVRTLTRKPCIVRPESPLEMQSAVGSESLSKMRLSQGSLLLRTLMGLRHRAAIRVDRYIAISSEIRTALEKAGVPRQAIRAIPNGIDTQRFAPVDAPRRRELRQRLGLPAEGLILLYTGRLAVSKGVLMLAAVWQELAPQYPAAHLVLIGTGRSSHDDCEAELRRFLECNSLGARTTVPGNVDQVEWYLQAADVFVFPSDSEGFGLSILEAMAVGLPMVSTRVGVAAEFPDEEGVALLVAPRDRAAFTGALRRLLDDPLLRESLARRAQGAVRAQYSMEAVARRHIELCIEAIGRATISAPPARQAREN
jgi:glycosyltransferase involved in cell wall biosynthesis